MERVLIIAEAGVNHNGNADLAFRLVDAAVAAKADAVKFQTFTASALVVPGASRARYQEAAVPGRETQLAMLSRLELPSSVYQDLAAYCEEKSIMFFSTPFDLASVAMLRSMGMRLFKIPSGEITNLPYLRAIGSLAQTVILSTGMSTMEEVAAALDVLEKAGTPRAKITLLHCTTEYPAPFAEVNLRAMAAMREAFPGIAGIGYSDHTEGLAVSIAAVALGASAIEKHFTLDKTMEGPDHAASLEPEEFTRLVRAVRQVEAALGDGIKCPTPSEMKNRDVARKSIVAACEVQAGEILTTSNLTTKRPGTGISPMVWDDILGTPAPRDLDKDELL